MDKFSEFANEHQSLPTSDLAHLAASSKYYFTLFQPTIDARRLLTHVVKGEHDSVQTVLKKDINLIFKRASVTDYSGRTFENISAIEYVFWALDEHMGVTMLECIPPTENRRVFEQLISQYKKIHIRGVTYKLNGKTSTEMHFDFVNTLIKELQVQIESRQACGEKDWAAIERQWIEGVGGAQRLLPIHVVHEYCSAVPFSPLPQFIKKPLPLTQFRNSLSSKNENWFDSELGQKFAIYKGRGSEPNTGPASHTRMTEAMRAGMTSILIANLNAMKSLFEVRIKAFDNLLQNTPFLDHANKNN
ncbi:F-box protein [Legionella lytica]|uniref:F-box protein n=1 Tax=Legionella lytica TaxID=96232 RepID=A0ABW8DBW9_9GAMM